MRKIRILEVIGNMNMGGAETFLMNVLRNIDQEKYELYFLCYGNKKYDYEDEINKLGGHICRINLFSFKNSFHHIKEIQEVILNNKIDVVHSHTYYNSMFSVIAAKKCKVKKIIVHSHNTFSEPSPSIIKKIYFSISKYVINNYSNVYLACGEAAGKALFYKKNNFEVVDNGIILNEFYYDKNICDLKRKELNIDNNSFVIGHVGRFDEVKNHKFIINTFKKIIEINPNSYLILIGDGVLKNEMIDLAKKLNIDNNILFLGKRHDVSKLYSAMDVLFFPSLFEGLPVTLIEAQANGVPILASDTIDNNVNITEKILFKSLDDSYDSWAHSIIDLKNKRYNCNNLMDKSIYNMKTNINKLENIYSRKDM